MTAAEKYFYVELPKRCGVHPANGRTAELIFEYEAMDDQAYARIEFESIEERARFALPYRPAPGYENQWDRGWHVAKLFFIYSDEKRMIEVDKELKAKLLDGFVPDKIEKQALAEASEWWN